MSKRIHVIINPAAGQDIPILSILNATFGPAAIEWQVFVTMKAGDARRFAEESGAAGVDAVAVYGGDGTVAEVASGLIGTDTPLAIFPGGTANVMSVELGIPSDLAEACALVCGDLSTTRTIDIGHLGDRWFLLRVGIGFEAEMVEGAPRELKDRFGVLAYAVSGLQALREPRLARYRLMLDGERVECEGLTCIIANAGSAGRSGFSLSKHIDVGDGLLDVLVIRRADVASLLSVASSIVSGGEAAEPIQHWQVREATVEAEPPQSVQADGEVLGETPVTARVIPSAVKVIIPRPDGAVE